MDMDTPTPTHSSTLTQGVLTAMKAITEGGRSRFEMASTLPEDGAPSAYLDCLKARTAPTHPRAPPEQLGSFPWPPELASGWPKVEEIPLSTDRSARHTRRCIRTSRRSRVSSPRAAAAARTTPCSMARGCPSGAGGVSLRGSASSTSSSPPSRWDDPRLQPSLTY